MSQRRHVDINMPLVSAGLERLKTDFVIITTLYRRRYTDLGEAPLWQREDVFRERDNCFGSKNFVLKM